MATFSYTLPTVGGSEDTWGTTLNANWTALGTFLGSLDSAELAVLDGVTSSTAELNLLTGLTDSLSGLTATATELNLLDGATVTTAEINILDGDTAATATTLADADRLVANDDGTMVQVALSDLLAYMQSNIATNPTGAIQPFAMSTAPSGWLECDGAAVSRTTYADLFAAIGTAYGEGDGSTTFNLPDFRGEFLRGWDNGRGVDAARTFGSAQGDAARNVTGTFGKLRSASVSGPPFSLGASYPNNIEDGGNTTREIEMDFSTIGSDYPTADENRPRNVAVLYCVKT